MTGGPLFLRVQALAVHHHLRRPLRVLAGGGHRRPNLQEPPEHTGQHMRVRTREWSRTGWEGVRKQTAGGAEGSGPPLAERPLGDTGRERRVRGWRLGTLTWEAAFIVEEAKR